MYWIFELIKDDGNVISYRYARESHDLDGVIVYDKKAQEIIRVDACLNDKNSDFCIDVARGKFVCFVADEGFPARRSVVCG